ncbi:MAG: HD domain-containing protein [Sphaerochaetaceae bacterium]|jgi:dGTPase|nr:HD domain-containing protein [Sphaerochaetaceae bacterium]MDD3164033.1 HD domain-containing protein [Sphaerochaetaceae bacterium]MDD4007296.1 HD domain-containing protein [Sphaerochaetaceae bacterium]
MKDMLEPSELQKRVRPRQEDIRGAYYRDTTAIIHSSPFRRLKHKTQVFFAPSNDHICTRIEHSLHVASIASAVCKGLGLNDEIAWAIGMGHDLGHTPFGHTGEKIISSIMSEKGLGPFQHEIFSLRIVDFLADLNLTYAVRDGIVCHCGEKFVQSIKPVQTVKDLGAITSIAGLLPSTWEGCVVRFSDQIAYLGRDFEDACRLKVVRKDELPSEVSSVLGSTNGEIINSLVNDLIFNSSEEKGIAFSDKVFKAVNIMKEFNYRRIYRSALLEGYEKYFSRLIRLVVNYLDELFEKNGFDEKPYREEKNMLAVGFCNHINEMNDVYLRCDGGYSRLVIDYVAGMSDNFCLDCANEILKPEHINESMEQLITGKWFDLG